MEDPFLPAAPDLPLPRPPAPSIWAGLEGLEDQALHTASPESVHCQAGQRLRGATAGPDSILSLHTGPWGTAWVAGAQVPVRGQPQEPRKSEAQRMVPAL